LVFFPSLSCHPSTFFGTAATCLCTSLAVINVVSFAFPSASITDVSAQIAKLFCKLTIHRHQCCRCPAYFSTFSVDLSAASHHLDILLFEVRCGTELTCFSTSHAGIYAALPFCVLECSSSRRHRMLMVMHSIYHKSTLLIEQRACKKYMRRLPAQIPRSRMIQILKLLLLF
jgi:hypothetical protein